VDTKRPPALTSPWKIGFLVSLLLIFLSVGVNYLIFYTFHLSWTCIGFDQGKLIFHRDQFMSQLFPLVGLVLLASLMGYLSITAAVRRYKTYLDSGHDYRNLLRVIREASDLDDEKIDSDLKKYPELKEMLGNLRGRIDEHKTQLDEREKQLEKREKGTIDRDKLGRECSVLAKAVTELNSGERLGALGLSIQELAPVEQAVRSMTPPAAGASPRGEERDLRLEDLQREIREVHDYLNNRLADCSAELRSGCASAQNIEKQLSTLGSGSPEKGVGPSADMSNGDMKVIHQLLDTVENLSETLNDLGEEAKGVAINTALQAGSGEGALADLIQLAEDVRRVAIKFTDVAMSYQETIERMRKSIGDIEARFANGGDAPASVGDLGGALSAVKSKISLLVERMIILSDQFKIMEESVGLSMTTIEEKLWAGRAGQPQPESDMDEPDVAFEAGNGKQAADDFEIVSNVGRMFNADRDSDRDSSEDTAGKGIPGLENHSSRVFSRSTETNEMFTDLSKSDELDIEPPTGGNEFAESEASFEELPPAGSRKKGGIVNLPADKAEGPVSDFAEETMVREFKSPEEGEESPPPAEEFMPEIQTGSGQVYDLDEPAGRPEPIQSGTRRHLDHNTLDLDGPGHDSKKADHSRMKGKPAGGIEDEEVAVDLYALGAVDYVS
jgi:hypothetical protein